MSFFPHPALSDPIGDWFRWREKSFGGENSGLGLADRSVGL